MNRIGNLLKAVASKRADLRWLDARQEIEVQRAKVEAFLSVATRPVYGFTTLLGHLDHRAATGADQRDLLSAHLVGPTTPLSDVERRLAWAVKLEQLSNGGSGISLDAYTAALRELEGERPPVIGNWNDSYGAGDVIPAAWLVAGLQGVTDLLVARPGNLIALINGHFFSTARALAAALRLQVELAHLVAAWAPEYVDWDGNEFPALKVRQFRYQTPTQRPLSDRDPFPVLVAIEACLEHLRFAIEQRLATPSFNPLWLEAGTGLTPVSSNSFLDHRLTMALTNAIQVAHLAAGLWQRLIHHKASELSSGDASPRLVQPPKVAQAVLEHMMLSSSAMPVRFAGCESGGIEDLRDLSLFTAGTVQQTTDSLARLRHIWAEIIPGGVEQAKAQAAAMRMLGMFVASDHEGLDASVWDAVGEFTRER